MMMQRRVQDPTKDIVNTDKWDGNPAARTRLLQAAVDRKVTGLVAVTGDIHRAYAGNLKVDFDNASDAPIGVELVASSISSGGDEKVNAEATLQGLVKANPHFRFFDARRGYVVCDFEKDRCEATFRAVESVATPNAPVSTIKTFEFEAKRQGLA